MVEKVGSRQRDRVTRDIESKYTVMCSPPAPDFRVAGDSTVAVLYGPRTFSQMDRGERIRACYQHACPSVRFGKSNVELFVP